MNNALKYNPNDWRVYSWIGYLYPEEPIKQIENYTRAISLNRGPELPESIRDLSWVYLETGFTEKAKQLNQEAFELDGDSISYINFLLFALAEQEDFEELYKMEIKLLKLDLTKFYPITFNLTGHHEEVYGYYSKEKKLYKDTNWVPLKNSHRIGVALLKMGKHEVAKEFFTKQIKYCNESIELGRAFETSRAAYYDLAGAYACLGEKQKSLQYLKELRKKKFIPLWWLVQLKVDPLFETIRNEPEYQQIVREIEAKYQAEHERVRKWLEEQGML